MRGNYKYKGPRHRNWKALRYFRIAILGSALLIVTIFSVFLLLQWRERRRIGGLKHYSIEAAAQIKKGNHERGIKLYEKILEHDPLDPKAHNMLGILYAIQGDSVASTKSFQKALKTGIRPATAHYNHGNVCLSQKDSHNAIRHFEQAAGLEKDYLPPRIMLATLYDSIGRREDTISMYEEIARIEKERQEKILADGDLSGEDCDRYRRFFEVKETFNRGYLLEKRGALEDACAEYSRAIERAPGFARAYYRRGLLLLKSGSRGKAEEDLKRAAELELDTTFAESALGDLYFKAGREDEAHDIFHTLSSTSPDNTFFKDYLAGILVAQKRYDDAEKVYREILRIDPNCSRAYEGLGNVSLKLDRLSDAERYYRKAISLNPDAPDPYYNLASLYGRMGDDENAVKWLRESTRRGFKDIDFMKDDPNLKSLREKGKLRGVTL